MAFDDQIAFRIHTEEREQFDKKCAAAGRVSAELLREIVIAFNNDNLRIIKSKDQTPKLEIYLDEH